MSRGTMHSKAFDGTDANLVTLAGLRKKIAAVTSMSTGSKIHKFCTSKGVTVADETMTFADYLQMEDTDAPENVTLPSVTVTYKLNSNINQPKVDLSTLPGAPGTITAGHEVGILPGFFMFYYLRYIRPGFPMRNQPNRSRLGRIERLLLTQISTALVARMNSSKNS